MILSLLLERWTIGLPVDNKGKLLAIVNRINLLSEAHKLNSLSMCIRGLEGIVKRIM
jgi:hypothetical protein